MKLSSKRIVVGLMLSSTLMSSAAFSQQLRPYGATGQGRKPSPDSPGISAIVPLSSASTPQDAGVRAHTNNRFLPPRAFLTPNSVAPKNTPIKPQSFVSPRVGPPADGLGYETPGSLACLYGLVTPTRGCNPNTALDVPLNKGGRAVAVVAAFGYPTALSDLATFSQQFGLPAPTPDTFVVKYATSSGGCDGPQPANDAGWENEQAVDVQAVHAMAPKAKIYLVEAQSDAYDEIMGAVKCANSLLTEGGQVSMSWGSAEFQGEDAYDVNFSAPNVVYFAASGDQPGTSYPAASPKVVSVGGTTISRAVPSLDFQAHASWVDGGGGRSPYYARPAYQDAVQRVVGAQRGLPDVSVVANPHTGMWIYDSNSAYGTGWFIAGGTSLSTALMAGIVNSMGAFRSSSVAELQAIYGAKGFGRFDARVPFIPISTGYCGPYANFLATREWNYCVGVGTVRLFGGGMTYGDAERYWR
ncbi:MAG: hypothetical protein ACR652_24240 [Methylocystis sp.]|uniref:hypothetical protein n=1 Tax=Methylocystis sp. TaxID=1911079 RepID=UPI003DA50AC3